MPSAISTSDARATTPSLKITGNPDLWQLACKVSGPLLQGEAVVGSFNKSTKIMNTLTGAVVQVTTEYIDSVGVRTSCAEALTFVSNCNWVDGEWTSIN